MTLAKGEQCDQDAEDLHHRMRLPRSRSTAERRYGELVQKLNCPPSLRKRLWSTLVGRRQTAVAAVE